MQSKPRKSAVELEMPADGMALPLIDQGTSAHPGVAALQVRLPRSGDNAEGGLNPYTHLFFRSAPVRNYKPNTAITAAG
jgi:hypothetical protein